MGEDNNTQQQAQSQQQNAQQGQPEQIDYAKIESMITKGTQQKENAILKSYFEQQGLTGEEMTAAVNAYKEQQQQAADAKKTAFADMEAENKRLKAEILQGQLDAAATKMAQQLGFDAKTAPYAIKLADMSKAVGADGKISADEIKTALEKVAQDVPALKSTAAGGGFVIGASGNAGDDGGAAQNELRRLFGVKAKN